MTVPYENNELVSSKCVIIRRAACVSDIRPCNTAPESTAFVIYLLHYQLLPENRLAALMADLFGVKVAAATIARMSRTCAERLRGFAQTVRDLVADAPVKHMDETGFRIGVKTQWLHVASTALLTFYRVCAKRGSLLANVAGIVVQITGSPLHDASVLHALCNARHVRELKALVEIEKEEWARKMQRLLRRACHAANRARERGVAMKPRLIECFERRYDAILAEGLAFHEAQAPLVRAATKGGGKWRGRAPRRTGHNLLLRLATRKEDTLRFLHDATVPFTNNQAERDGRMMKLRQKISGGFRSSEGAMDFALIRSFFSTARKQGWNIIDALIPPPIPLGQIPTSCLSYPANLGSNALGSIYLVTRAFSARARVLLGYPYWCAVVAVQQSASGQKHELPRRSIAVRFALINGHWDRTIIECPLMI